MRTEVYRKRADKADFLGGETAEVVKGKIQEVNSLSFPPQNFNNNEGFGVCVCRHMGHGCLDLCDDKRRSK